MVHGLSTLATQILSKRAKAKAKEQQSDSSGKGAAKGSHEGDTKAKRRGPERWDAIDPEGRCEGVVVPTV